MTLRGSRVQLASDGDLGLITLSHPPVNALDNAALSELLAALRETAASPSLRAVVLTAGGDRVFCAGGDLTEWATLDQVGTNLRLALLHEMLVALESFDKPVVCAVNGDAVGAGCEIVLFADMAIATKHARFGFPEIQSGLVPISKGIKRLIEVTGPRVASELLLQGTLVDAATAKSWGLINKIVEPTVLARRAREEGHRLASVPSALTKAMKRSIRLAPTLDNQGTADLTNELYRGCAAGKAEPNEDEQP